MSIIGVFTPIISEKPSFLGIASDCISFSREKAYVIPDTNEVVLLESSDPNYITILKVFAYATIVIPLIMFAVSFSIRNVYDFKVLDVEEQLKTGVDVSEEIMSELATLDNIRNSEKIDWKVGDYRVFALKSAPDLVFKQSSGRGIVEPRWDNIVFCEKIRLLYKLDHLVIPHAKLIDVGDKRYLVEEKKKIATESYLDYDSVEAVEQLALFIIKTGISDIWEANIPRTDDGKIVLCDLEERYGPAVGLFGSEELNRKGLIFCVLNSNQIDAIKNVADRHEVSTPERQRMNYQFIKTSAVQLANNERDLMAFYENAGITLETARTLIQTSSTELGLSSDQEKVLQEVMDVINQQITKDHKNPRTNISISLQREVFFDNQEPIFINHDKFLSPIFEALKKRGYLFEFQYNVFYGFYKLQF